MENEDLIPLRLEGKARGPPQAEIYKRSSFNFKFINELMSAGTITEAAEAVRGGGGDEACHEGFMRMDEGRWGVFWNLDDEC